MPKESSSGWSRPGEGDAWSNVSGNNYGTEGPSRESTGIMPPTAGKVRSPGAWGGYTGRMVDDGTGNLVFDPNQSGRADTVNHLQGLATAAANQQAYQNDYGRADEFAAMGQQGRAFQVDPMILARDAAQGRNLQSQILGQRMLQQGIQAQQAGAASARGGSLAQAAAMRQQAAGQGAFMQQGNAALEAQRAADMAAAREQYMQQATSLRAGDAQAQGLNQQQGMQQMQNELQQRQLNQKGQMGYDSLAQDTNIAASNAALGQHEANAGLADVSMQRHQNKLDRTIGWIGDATQAAGTLGASLGTSGGSTPGQPPPAGSGSDARMKTHIASLATAALRRKAAY